MEELLHGEEKVVWGDKAYAGEAKKEEFEERGIKWCVSKKANRGRTLSAKDKERNRRMSKTRARGELTWPGKNGHSAKLLFQDTTFPRTVWD